MQQGFLFVAFLWHITGPLSNISHITFTNVYIHSYRHPIYNIYIYNVYILYILMIYDKMSNNLEQLSLCQTFDLASNRPRPSG